MKTDIQIAQEAQMAHIKDVAATVGIEEEEDIIHDFLNALEIAYGK